MRDLCSRRSVGSDRVASLDGGHAPRRDVTGRRVEPGKERANDFFYTVVTAEPPARPGSREQRNDKRVRTRLQEGVIAERPGRGLVDCRIRDRSRTGARLQLDKDRPLPRRFLLTDTACRSQFWATLMWQVGRDAGVKLSPV